MNNIFFTADPHLGHDNIRKHCNRPWPNIEAMNDAITVRWNRLVKRGDTVYVLGDFAMIKKVPGVDSMKMYRHHFHALNGRKILVLGNHDGMSREVYRECFSDVFELKEIRIDHQRITLCHYPMRSWNASYHGSWHFFGHVHGRLPEHPSSLSCDVGVDVPEWNYTPIPWDVLKPKMLQKVLAWKEYWGKRDHGWEVSGDERHRVVLDDESEETQI